MAAKPRISSLSGDVCVEDSNGHWVGKSPSIIRDQRQLLAQTPAVFELARRSVAAHPLNAETNVAAARTAMLGIANDILA